LPATSDFFLVLVSTEQLESLQQMMVKQLKSRYGDINKKRRFAIGIDKRKMKFSNVDEEDQNKIIKKVDAEREKNNPVAQSYGKKKPGDKFKKGGELKY
jgi:hypothetical protein